MSTVLAVAGIWCAASAAFAGLIALAAHRLKKLEQLRAQHHVVAQAEQFCRIAAATTH